MKHTLGINLWNWIERFDGRALPLFAKVRAMGYGQVEFGLDALDFDPVPVRREAEALGLEVSLCAVLSPGRDLSNEDAAVREATKTYLRDAFVMAHALGARAIGGAVYAGGGRARMVGAEQRRREWEWAVEGLRELAPVAQDCGLTVGIEPLNRYKTDMVNRAQDALRLCRDIGEPCYRVLFDTYQASIEEKSIPDAIRAVGGAYLGHFHASENDRGCPGTGQVDWDGTFAALREIEYRGPIVVESFCVSPRDSVWRATEVSQDALAEKAFRFLSQKEEEVFGCSTET